MAQNLRCAPLDFEIHSSHRSSANQALLPPAMRSCVAFVTRGLEQVPTSKVPLRKKVKRVDAVVREPICRAKNYKKVKLAGVIYGKTERPPRNT